MDSPIVNYKQGADMVASRIFLYRGEKPYLAVLYGVPGIGKTHFAKEVIQKVWPAKKGEVVKPHDLARNQYQLHTPDYLLIENQESLPLVIEMETKRNFHKTPDLWVLLVSDLAKILDPPRLTLEMILHQFNFVVENSFSSSR